MNIVQFWFVFAEMDLSDHPFPAHKNRPNLVSWARVLPLPRPGAENAQIIFWHIRKMLEWPIGLGRRFPLKIVFHFELHGNATLHYISRCIAWLCRLQEYLPKVVLLRVCWVHQMEPILAGENGQLSPARIIMKVVSTWPCTVFCIFIFCKIDFHKGLIACHSPTVVTW